MTLIAVSSGLFPCYKKEFPNIIQMFIENNDIRVFFSSIFLLGDQNRT